jgi:hypothetical protein
VLLWPTGMLSVLSGSIDDGWNGLLGWFWVACAITTLVLTFVTRAALKERAYSAVMAATELLYLAILTAFGTDLVAPRPAGGLTPPPAPDSSPDQAWSYSMITPASLASGHHAAIWSARSRSAPTSWTAGVRTVA